ncbi:DUF1801 domain-containing protein [Liberiplasma polymorphum]|uniref:DUF1801 domain-containing protein n=1 Tax=Liberiplasma polymorphum TaxID=3374570 RepID=UPI003775DAD5
MEITSFDIDGYLDSVDLSRKEAMKTLIELGKRITHKEPVLWGTIVGFGNLHYKYKTGHEGDMPLLGLASRKQAITLYIAYELESYELLKSLGKYKVGKSCLYIKKLSDINMDVLEALIKEGIKETLNLPFITDNELKAK